MRWRIFLFDGLRAECDDRVITRFQTQKTGVLLAYLAYHIHQTHPRETLVEMLWPECEPTAGRARLSTALSSLRRQLEPPGVTAGTVIVADRASVRLNPAVVTTDVAEFHAALQSAAGTRSSTERSHLLAGAVDLYSSGFLSGYCDGWIPAEQEALAEGYFRALRQLLAHLERAGDLNRALDYARRGVSADPLREEAHHDLIRLVAAAGRPAAALRHYRELERLLRQEFGTAPSVTLQALIGTVNDHSSGTTGRSVPTRTAIALLPRVSDGTARSPFPSSSPHPALLAGIVTYLLAEIEAAADGDSDEGGGAPRSEGHGAESEAWAPGMANPRVLLRQAFEKSRGCVIEDVDGVAAVAFAGASDALACAVAVQRDLAGLHLSPPPHDPPCGYPLLRRCPPRARMALHTGEVESGEELNHAGLQDAMRLLLAAHPGQILLSEGTAALLRQHLEPTLRLTDLGLYHLHNAAAPERLFQVCYPGMAEHDFAPPNAPPAHAGQLPVHMTRFFGRAPETARLRALLLARENRLVTLTGPGGSGKSRLALEVAEQVRGEWRGAVWFVSLVDLTDPRLIADKTLDALRLPRSSQSEPLEQVVAFLARQPSLLLLDNFEHLVPGGVPLLQTLLERVPSPTCLVTSRQRLGLEGEQEFPVAPLPVPVESGKLRVESPTKATPDARSSLSPLSSLNSPLSTLAACPSVQLFVDRAQVSRPDFQVTKANAAAVAELCRRLEGLPLAIELAAARVGVLTPAQMLERLPQRFELLVGRQRTADPRHRSLRAALDWSYQLLSPELQRFFARLSAFWGGWTLEAAEAVCASDSARTLNYLEHLRECSLVIAQPAGTEVRYRLLETLREYAAEQLAPDERTALGRRHAQHYLHLAEEAAARLSGPEQGKWLARLEQEHDNLRASLSRSLESVEAQMGLRLGGALWRFWQVRGHLAEGRDWLARLLMLHEVAAPDGTQERTEARARVLDGLGSLASEQGDYEAARGCFEESLLTWTGLNNGRAEADSLYGLGDIRYYQGEYATARCFYDQSLAIYRVIGDQHGIAMTLDSLGTLSQRQGDFQTARSLHAESLRILRLLGDDEEMAYTLGNLGNVASVQGDHEAARAHFAERLALFQALGSRDGIASAFGGLSELAFREGDLEAARAHAEKYLAMEREIGRRRGIALALDHLGRATREQGDLEAAASLHQQSLSIWRELHDRWNIARTSAQLAAALLARGDSGTAQSLFAESLKVQCAMGEILGSQECLEGLAKAAVAQRQASRAARLFGAAEALRAAMGASLPAKDHADHGRYVEIVRAALDEATFAAQWAEGRAMTLEQATAEALREPGLTAPTPVQQTASSRMRLSSGRPACVPPGDLTTREWERIAPLLPQSEGRRGRPFQEHRRVINGILWKLRTGAPWRDLPPRYRSWHTCHERYRRWRRNGLWERIEEALASPADPASQAFPRSHLGFVGQPPAAAPDHL